MEKEEILQALSNAKRDISAISHTKKSNSSYNLISDIVRQLKYKLVSYYDLSLEEENTSGYTRDLHLSAQILKMYKHKGSDKHKDYVIEDFKKEYLYDLDKAIRTIN